MGVSFKADLQTDVRLTHRDWNIEVDRAIDEPSFVLKLNSKIMRTPMNNLMRLKNETLAHAIANEWRIRSRRKKLNLPSMYLTSLLYEAIDNPFEESKEAMIESILEYFRFDTVRLRDAENPELLAKQSRHWDPIVSWFEHKFKCHLPIDYNALTETISIPGATIDNVAKHLMLQSRYPLVGARFMTQNLKSYVLTTSLMDSFLKPEEAVELARLETRHQTEKWSTVEGEHDIDEQGTNARVAAGSLFYHLST